MSTLTGGALNAIDALVSHWAGVLEEALQADKEPTVEVWAAMSRDLSLALSFTSALSHVENK